MSDAPTPHVLQAVLDGFEQSEPFVSVWKRYPWVSPEENEATDSCACDSMSQRFAAFSGAVVVEGADPVEDLEYHRWARMTLAPGEVWNVDWTARQFHNLEHPESPLHQDLPCPLVWKGPGHPVVSFGRIREVRTWTQRAEAILQDALDRVETHDVIPEVSAALACLRIEAGELPADELDGYPFPGEEDERDAADCICSPDQLERGGFKGGCPVHASGVRR